MQELPAATAIQRPFQQHPMSSRQVLRIHRILFVYSRNLHLDFLIHYFVSAVQGHPRSLILVPIDSAYATSY